MQYTSFIAIILLLFSCNDKPSDAKVITTEVTKTFKETQRSDFQIILDSALVEGSILIFDPQKKAYFSNDFNWAKTGRLPASTFKIPNSIIGLETGVVESDQTVFPWDGEERQIKSWEQDLTLKEAFHKSCVPCYQQMARAVGIHRMNAMLAKLEFGDMGLIDSTNLDLFWLVGDSKINQFQEINFLSRLYNSELPISPRTDSIMKQMIVIESTDDYKLSGKTGWAMREGFNNGWFVGFVEKGDAVFYFATNIEPREAFDMEMFPAIRAKITRVALKQLGVF